MPSIRAEITIPKPIEEVFDRYTDHAAWAGWIPLLNARVAEPGENDPNGKGALRVLGSFGINAYERILHFERPTQMDYTMERGAMPIKDHLGQVRFVSEAGHTKILWTAEFQSTIWGLGLPIKLFVQWFFRFVLWRFAKTLAG